MAKISTTVSTHSHAAQSVMARILSTENINIVIDNSAHTAAFDLKNRTLILPQWKDMGKSVYDMLIGHEISHALHTPAEGWRSTCDKISGTTETSSKAWQTASLYLNVVEDARIERLIQIKFPGFRRDFIAAYADLNAKNFFGVKGMDLNTLTLADRINLYYKLGTIGAVGIRFTADEDAFIRRIDAAQSFDDAAQIAEDLFKFCREQQQQKQQQTQPPQKGTPTPGNNDAGMSGDSAESDGEGDESQQGNSDGEGEDESKSGGNSSAAPQGDSEESKQPSGAGRGSAPASNVTDPAPTPMTQQKFNENLSNNTDRATNDWDVAVTTPTVLTFPDIDRVVVDCKEILAAARTDVPAVFNPTDVRDVEYMKRVDAVNEKFFRDSKRQIDLLVKQFELRKAAAIAKRESVRKTGVLDTVRMVNYKHSEDIFRRNIMLPEGKNHGLVMFIDWSGSMATCIDAVMEQTFVLCEFCRRIGIPFEVFAFSTTNFRSGKSGDRYFVDPADVEKDNVWQGDINKPQDAKVANPAPNVHHTFSLLNLLSSRLNKSEYRDTIRFLRALTCRNRGDFQNFYMSVPPRWELTATALDETIVAAMKIVPQFRENNRLDIVNTIFLTDGDTSCPYTQSGRIINPETKAVYSADEIIKKIPSYPSSNSRWNPARDSNYSTDILLMAFRDITGSRAVGMFLTRQPYNITRCFREQFAREFNREMANRKVGDRYAEQAAWRNAEQNLKTVLNKQFKEDNCLVADEGTTGYDEFFIIKSDTRVIAESDPLKDLAVGDSLLRVKRAFAASFNNSNKSRVLVNRFIELIAR